MSISIESPRPEVHDAIRGIPGVWKRSVKVPECLIERGVNVQVNSVVMNPSKNDLADLL